jgi:hypothetical protein
MGKNCKAYWAIFDNLKKRFSKRFLDIYLKNSFHDLKIKDIIVIDSNKNSQPNIEITIGGYGQYYRITYKRVKKFEIKYEEGIWPGFDDWGYDEFLPIDDQYLSHEILFASDSTIYIQFKNKNIFITKLMLPID